MLRTRTNDTVEILKLDNFVEDYNFSINETYNLKGIRGIDILKYNIILLGGLYFYKSYETDTAYVGFAYDEMNSGAYTIEVFDNSIYYARTNFVSEDIIKAIPTDVRLVENQGKLQLQTEHDTQVLSIDEGVNDLLGRKFGYKDIIENEYSGFFILNDTSNSDYYFEIYGDFKIYTDDLLGVEEYNLSQLFTNVLYESDKPLTVYAYDGNKSVVGLIAFNREQDGYVSTLTDLDFQGINNLKVVSYTLINIVTGNREEL